MIKRDYYLNKMIKSLNQNLVKVIVGMRRCGKSYLLFNIFKDYLINQMNVDPNYIIEVDLEKYKNVSLRILDNFYEYVNSKLSSLELTKTKYIFIDEIQLLERKIYLSKDKLSKTTISFYEILNEFLTRGDCQIFVTGSNSKMLSNDIATEFRGRSLKINVYPLSFSEYKTYLESLNSSKKLNFLDMYNSFTLYGSLPATFQFYNNINNDNDDIEGLKDYLKDLYLKTYLSDIIERYSLKDKDAFSKFNYVLASNISNYINPNRLLNLFKSKEDKSINLSNEKVRNYLSYMKDSFLLNECCLNDLKGNSIIGSLSKYYFTDLGIRNSILNFNREITSSSLGYSMENVVYNELVKYGYTVFTARVNTVEKDSLNKSVRKEYEVDFLANKNENNIYIQVCHTLDNIETYKREVRPFELIKNNFNKVIITSSNLYSGYSFTKEGYKIISLEAFLDNPSIIE